MHFPFCLQRKKGGGGGDGTERNFSKEIQGFCLRS